MIFHTKLRNALETTIRELEVELRQSQNEKITEIANLWVEWNARLKSPREVVAWLEIILKDEVAFAWQKYSGKKDGSEAQLAADQKAIEGVNPKPRKTRKVEVKDD